MNRLPFSLALLLSACAPPTASTAPVAGPPMPTPSETVRRFRMENKPRIVGGVPRESVLERDARSAWCERLNRSAHGALARQGDVLVDRGACAVEVTPGKERNWHGPRVVFDAAQLMSRPYAAASYDRDSQTIALPIDSLERDWLDVPATKHELLHARIHEKAQKGDPYFVALQSTFAGPKYEPDFFAVDEVPVNLCDMLRTLQGGGVLEPWRAEMTRNYSEMLASELTMLKVATVAERETHAGVPGSVLAATGEQTKRWGGGEPEESVPLLEKLAEEAARANVLLAATPPSLAAVQALPTIAKVCAL